jgi:hypothetical protein
MNEGQIELPDFEDNMEASCRRLDKKQLFGPVVGAAIRIHKVPQATTRQKSSPTLALYSLHLHDRSFFLPSVVKEYKGTFVFTAMCCWILLILFDIRRAL